MRSKPSPDALPVPPAPVKIVIAGGFGVGKTTAVAAISEIPPLRTEAAMTEIAATVDSAALVPAKTTTTVALDFGRITIGSRVVLYLFGLPGQERFSFMWDELSYGALGVVILADVRRLADCFPSVNYFERQRLPFVVAINCFDDAPTYDPEEIRLALDLDTAVPLVLCDAREISSVKQVLITLVETIAARPSGAASNIVTPRT